MIPSERVVRCALGSLEELIDILVRAWRADLVSLHYLKATLSDVMEVSVF